MAKFRFNHYIDIHWNGYDIVGDAGTIFSIPDQLYEEFESDLRPVEPSLEWTVVNEFLELQNSVSVVTLEAVAPIVVTPTSTGRSISLNANYQTAGTYVTSVSGTAPITASGTTAITVGIDQSVLTVSSATNADVLRLYVKNSTGTTLNKGQPVYISSSDGNNALISLASATNDATSSKTLGLLAQTLLTGEHGYVIENGLLTGIDTSTATAGQAVWLSATPGQVVYGTPPAEPAHGVYLGVVTRVQSVNGAIAVKVQNGYEIDELHDVSAGSPSDGDIIQYKTSSGLWTKSSLVNSATSTSTTSVPTANAVRIANNAATAAQSTADLKLAKAGDTLTGTLTISNTGSLAVFGATSTANTQVTTRVDGDTSTRWGVRADGFQAWGDGTAARDTNLYRSAANTLATDDNFDVGLNLTVGGDIIHASQLDFIAGGAVGASVISSGLYLPPSKTIRFEGTTNDSSEIGLTAADATADRTITLPDDSGTVALTYNTPPVGSIVMWATTTAPSGWLFCDGTSYAYNTYPTLGALFGGTPGGNFNVPDLRDRFIAGSATISAASNNTGTFAPNTSNTHTHTTDIAHGHADTIAVSTHADHTHSTNPAATTSGFPSTTTTISYASGGLTSTPGSSTHTHSTDIAATTSGAESANLTHTVTGGVTSLGTTSVTSSSGSLLPKAALLNFIIKS